MRLKFFGYALGVILLPCTKGFAQTYAESALQFGRGSSAGSARFQAIGGATTALGGDYTSSISNPAGLGMYNRSELTFSPGFNAINTSARYLGNKDEEIKSSLNLPGISLVLNFPREKQQGFISGSFSISMSRMNDFNQSISYNGVSRNHSSIIDSFLDKAAGATTAQFDYDNSPTRLAYDNYLIGPKTLQEPPGSDTEYFSDVDASEVPIQHETIQNKGGIYQWNFSYGANYNDKLFFGASLGLSSLKYISSKTYSEIFSGDRLNNLQLNENLNVRGSGVNLTVGMIARPANHFQAGFSFTTPTIYQLSEKYDASMNTSWNNFDYWDGEKNITLNDRSSETDIVTSDYTLITPLKANAGIAYISKHGFITGDLELTTPGMSRYSSSTTGLSFSNDNNEIRSTYRSVLLNYKVGGEYRLDMFRFRLGYGVQANSYKNAFDTDNTITTISGGIGIRKTNYFIDFALVNSSGGNSIYSPYAGAQNVTLSTNLTKAIFTVGFTF